MSVFRRKKRILIAAVDIGYRMEHYSKFISEELAEELEVESFSKYVVPKNHFKTSYTFICPTDEKSLIYVRFYLLYFFVRALFKYDILHFLSGETILTRKLRRFELATYRLLGKKIIMHFVGSDIRSEIYLAEKNEHLIEWLNGEYKIKSPISEEFQIKLITDSRKYAHQILISTPDLFEIFPEADYIPVFIDLSLNDYTFVATNENEKVVIFHSPSKLLTKGSIYIHTILSKIENQFKDDLQIIAPGKILSTEQTYPSTRYEMFEQMKKSDIVIDQMLIGWYGLKSLEALAFGNTVFCYIDSKIKDHLFDKCPIISSNISDLEEVLIREINKLLSLKNRRKVIQENRIYLEKNHSIQEYREKMIEIWRK